MTATENRRAGVTPVLPHLMPLAVVLVLFGLSVPLAMVAPSRVTSGVYQVVVGDIFEPQFVLPTEALTCGRAGDTATCTAQVAGRTLTVELVYDEPHPGVGESACAASFDGRTLSCSGSPYDYGHVSDTALIPRPLDLTDDEVAALRAEVPWWRDADNLPPAVLAVVVSLAAAMGLAGLLLGPRARPLPSTWRPWVAVGAGGLGVLLYGAGSLVIAPGTHGLGALMAASLAGVGPLALAGWQLQLARSALGSWRSALIAVAATATMTGATALVFLLDSGFID